jgi:hypothetical protein
LSICKLVQFVSQNVVTASMMIKYKAGISTRLIFKAPLLTQSQPAAHLNASLRKIVRIIPTSEVGALLSRR